ncbi:MAG TPA: alkaline phosphatase family protein, partial [Pseudomonadota bacterium]|nr:alkaline phosphatase family protein [Pseudomonadota bacterium]
MRRFAWIATFVLVVMAAWWWSDRPTEPGPRGSDRRVIVIGFDGLDPNLLAEARAAGRLPNFSALATQGHLQSLATTDPPQSPVAWSSFATGTGPGEHGVFDFLHRDPE